MNAPTNILAVLRMNQEEYNKLQFDYGLKYLDKLTGHLQTIMQELIESAMFWGWWKLQYKQVDEVFIRRNCCKTLADLRMCYENIHINLEILPDKVVFNEINKAYASMIGEFIDEILMMVK